MFGVNFTYSIQTAASDVDIENARHRTESDSDDGCPAESPEMVFSQAEMLNEADGDNTLGNKDIHKIISQCLKDAKKLQSGCTVKILTQLTAVSEYVKLQALYFTYGKCKKPHINASLAIAQCMGKGPYFTQQICNNEKCFLIITIFPSQRPESQTVQKVYWTMKMYFILSKSTLPHRNLDPSLHFSSANTSTL